MNIVCKQLEINYPIIQGGMGNISNGLLTAAVSDAGGLGTIGCGTMTPTEVEKIILETKRLTNQPFAINMAINVTPYMDELIQLVIKHNIPVVSLSAGNPAPYIPFLQDHHIKVMTLIASVKHAQKSEAAGADIVVAEGFEAAGINSGLELTTFTLIPQVVKHVNIPVLAAGGIGDGKGLAAAFMLGASGVQLGTRFIATKEAPFHKDYKRRLVESKDTATTVVGRTIGQTRRILQTPFANKLSHLEENGLTIEQYGKLTSEKQHIIGALEGNMDAGFLNGGQVAGLIDDIPSVKDLLHTMVSEAKLQINDAVNIFN